MAIVKSFLYVYQAGFFWISGGFREIDQDLQGFYIF